MRSPNGSHVLTIMGRWYDVISCKSHIDSNRGCGMTSPRLSHILTVIGGVV